MNFTAINLLFANLFLGTFILSQDLNSSSETKVLKKWSKEFISGVSFPIIKKEDKLITPLLDVLLVPEDTPVDKIETWNDGIGKEWKEFLPKIINKHENIFCEKYKINATVSNYLAELLYFHKRFKNYN